jgi:uncharacterized OsmC-like protein
MTGRLIGPARSNAAARGGAAPLADYATQPATSDVVPRVTPVLPGAYQGATARLDRARRRGIHPPDRKEQHVSTTIATVRNGVDTQTLFATLDAVKAQPELGTFQFRVHNRWLDGAHNRSTIKDFYAAGGEDTSRADAFELDAGEPAILIGTDTGPNPAEFLLHALAACLTTSLVYVAAARKVHLTRVESRIEGDMDVRGALGLSDDVRNGFDRIRVSFVVEGDAPRDRLRELVERAKARSAVFDMVTNGVPVDVEVEP